MRMILDLIKREPVLFTAAIQSGITLVTAFGLQLSQEQVGAILLFTSSLLALFARAASTSNVAVAEQVEVALNTMPPEEGDGDRVRSRR